MLILCSPHPLDKPYLAELQAQAKKFEGHMKLVFTSDFKMPHYVMQWRNTRVLAILSRAESFSLIPIKARFYRNENMMLLVSNIGGLLEQVTSGIEDLSLLLETSQLECSWTK